MDHAIVTPGAPIAFRVKFNDGTSLSADEIVRVVLYTSRLLTRLWFDEAKTTEQPIEVKRSDDGAYIDIVVTGETAALLPEGFVKIHLSVWDAVDNVVKRRYERTVLEIGAYYAGSTWNIESNDNILIVVTEADLT